MRIIDQAGVVRDLHVGYSATLRESLNGSIDRLLKSNPVASAEPAEAAK
jgi:hypothetical protein